MFNIVLLEPEIPSNTGNIGRTCLVTGSRLHLIEPMGFIINDRNLKRAGMDYWKDIDAVIYDSWRDFLIRNAENINITPAMLETAGLSSGLSLEEAAAFKQRDEAPKLWMSTTKALNTYDQADFRDGDYIMFGKESAGIPEEILMADPPRAVRIPMQSGKRSLNLSNSVAIVLYEALRQNKFQDLELMGQLHWHRW